MSDIGQACALILAGMTLGWTMLFSFVVAPISYADMDYGRAARNVGRVMKAGHGAVALFAFLAGFAALLCQAWGAAAVLALAGCFYLMAKWALAPREGRAPPIGHRKLKTARVVASGLTAAIMPLIIAGVVMVLFRV
jgi:hypothetical protein